MAMVFAAEGLDASETVLMLAYCNHTDAHGYCWPGITRLADETGMSERTVKRTNSRLKARKLIKSIRRTGKDGTPVTNLTRVNLALLNSMRRPERVYDDNLVEALTFDDETPKDASELLKCQSGTYPGANLAPTRGQSDTWVGANLAPKSSVETSEKPPPPSAQQPRKSQTTQEEERMSERRDSQSPHSPERADAEGPQGPGVSETPGPQASSDGLQIAQAVVDACVEQWGGHRAPTPAERRRLALRVAQALAEGADRWAVRFTLTRDLDPSQVTTTAVQVVMHRTSQPDWWREVRVPFQPTTVPRPPWCGTCAETTRMWENTEGKLVRCRDCHPLAESDDAPLVDEIQDVVNEKPTRVPAEAASVRGEPCPEHGRAPRHPETGACVLCDVAAGAAKFKTSTAKKPPAFTA